MSASITRFVGLRRPKVEEVHNVEWDEFLTELARDPGCAYAGKYEHPGWAAIDLDPPSRANENVQRVHALVLDYDENPLWDKVIERWGASYGLLYTTKRHTAECARLRVVLPLTRPVTRDEYPKIWQWGKRVGLEMGLVVDENTKDPSRYWYEPSVPAGGWRSEMLTGAFVDPDAILALSFIDEAPKRFASGTIAPPTDDERERRARAWLAKATGAIEGDGGSRRTWNVIAEIMFGFDLTVAQTYRLVADEWNPRCDPPWTERDLDRQVHRVAERCTRERGYKLQTRVAVTSSASACLAAPALDEHVNVDWESMILRSPKGKVIRGLHNVQVIVRHHPHFMGRWTFNTMTNSAWIDNSPTTEKLAHRMRAFIDLTLKFTPSLGDVEAAIIDAAGDRPFHPLQAHLRSLEWDGAARLNAMAREHLGTDSELHAVLLRKWMISAVARAMNPGCKVDTMLVLAGGQGVIKSTFFNVLGGAWYSDTSIDLQDKDRFGAVHSAWILELAEFDSVMRGRDASRLKAFVSSAKDLYRAPYARDAAWWPRSSVFGATTNQDEFLEDDTGSRRFWIIPVRHRIDVDLLAHARDQLWAEALVAYESGEPWWLDDEHESLRTESNTTFESQDVWAGLISDWIETYPVSDLPINSVLERCLKIDPGQRTDRDAKRVAKVLKQLGWTKHQKRFGGKRLDVYQKR